MADLYDLGDTTAARRSAEAACTRLPSGRTASASRATPGSARCCRRRPSAPDEVLVYVMASGINFNNVWAALGQPLDVIAERQKLGEPEDFHAGGSDCSGIVWAIGKNVTNVKVGDEVIVHSGWWRADDPWVLRGQGSDARGEHAHLGLPDQLRQLLPVRARAGASVHPQAASGSRGKRPGCFLLCASTAYRMLMGWAPNIDRAGRRRARVGRGRRTRQHGARDHARDGRPRRRRRLGRSQARRSAWSTARSGVINRTPVQPLGRDAGHQGRARPTASGPRARAPSARRSGTRSASARARASSSSIRARRRCRPRSSSARPAG